MKKSFLLTLLGVFSLIALSSSASTKRNFDTGLVVSGGVSLGSYQGGFLRYLSEYQNINSKVTRVPQVYAGASAGSMNSFITLLELGRTGDRGTIKESLFWKLWVPLGINRLVDRKEMSAINFLSKRPVKSLYKNAREIWNAGLRSDYDVIFGVTLTQKNPEVIEVYKGGRKYQQMLNEAIFRIRGQGAGKTPLIQNLILKNNKNSQIYLPFGKDQNQNLTLLLSAIEASGAFPLAFSPVDISYCKYSDFIKLKKCSSDSLRTRTFIDGGMFNNVPLSIVNKVSEHHVAKDNFLLIVDPSDGHFFYNKEDIEEESHGVTKYALDIFDSFIGTARSREMISFYESPSFSTTVSSTVTIPLASSPMYAFFGFFEEDFRRFDFLVGYADAITFTDSYSKHIEDSHLIEIPRMPGLSKDENCLVRVVAEKDFNKSCLKDMGHNFKTLLRISVGNILENCQYLNNLKLCRNPELIANSELYNFAFDQYKYDEEESITQYSLRKLKEDKFQFNELYREENPIDRSDAPFLIINEVHNLLDDFSTKLNFEEKFIVKSASKVYLDSIYYVPYDSYTSVDLGTLVELTFANSFGTSSRQYQSIKWTYGLTTNSILDYQEADNSMQVVIPTIGLEKTILYWSDETLQYSLGIKGGYMFSTNDKYDSQKCSKNTTSFFGCSGVYLQAYPLFTFYERFRVKPLFMLINSPENREVATGLEIGINL